MACVAGELEWGESKYPVEVLKKDQSDIIETKEALMHAWQGASHKPKSGVMSYSF